jgi:putative ABC transport system permease protein
MVRARKATLAGTFIALALGVALLSAMALTLASSVGGPGAGPRWFTKPDVVLAGTNTVSITTVVDGDRETETVRTVGALALPADLPTKLSTVDAEVVVDRAGYAVADGAPGDTVHPWSAASLHDYRWVAGGPPRDVDDLVLTAPTAHRPGDRITVLTALGAARYTVSGVLETAALPAFYATDPRAAELAGGRIEAIALTSRNGSVAAEVRGMVPAGVRVLTGAARRDAEPDPDGEKLAVAASLLGTTSGLAGFVSIFVVSGTFAYAVAARRREFGLLRTAGATPRQVRRLVLGEALAVGVLASVAGAVLGTVLAPPFAHWLARSGFAPADFTAHFIFWPIAAAFGVGLLVALVGAWLAARRAGKVRPVEALREAAVDRKPMTVARWVVGLLCFGGAVPLIAVSSAIGSAEAVALILVIAMVLIIGLAMLAPVLIPPLVTLFTAPLSASRGAVGMLARHGARAAIRRTAATAAPILVTVGIAGSTLAATGMIWEAQQAAARSRIAADAIVTGPGLTDPTVAALRTTPGVTAAVPVTDTTVYLPEFGFPEEWSGRYADGGSLTGVLNLPVSAGNLADLTGTDTIAVPAGRWRVGDTVGLWLADSTPVRLRVVATFTEQLDLGMTVLLPAALRAGHERPVADAVYLRLSPGAAPPPVPGGTVVRTADYLSAADVEQERANRLALTAVLGMALLYTGIAIANTLVMATGDRARDLATLRLSGATPRQVLRMVGVEAILVTAIGVLLAAVVTAITVAGMRAGLTGLAPSIPLAIPWATIGGIAVVCLLTAVLASVIPAALLLRRSPVELAGVRE